MAEPTRPVGHVQFKAKSPYSLIYVVQQEEIALWTGVEGNGSIPSGDGTNGYYFYHEYGVHHGKGVHYLYGSNRGYMVMMSKVDPKEKSF